MCQTPITTDVKVESQKKYYSYNIDFFQNISKVFKFFLRALET